MSETLAMMITELIAADVSGRSPDLSSTAQPPGHTGSGERFGDEPEEYTRKNISDDLLAALAYFLFHGCSNLPQGDDQAAQLDFARAWLLAEGIKLPGSPAPAAERPEEEAVRRAEEAARRAEEAAREAREDRRRAEDERRRAEASQRAPDPYDLRSLRHDE